MAETRERHGFRGYIASRPIQGVSFPQRLQNLTIRDYAARNGLAYKLSATEYAMSGAYMMLKGVLDELPLLAGVIVFSCFMLPQRKARRLDIYERVLGGGAVLHAALENLALRRAGDMQRWEDLIDVAAALPATPFGGRYEKTEQPLDAALIEAFLA